METNQAFEQPDAPEAAPVLGGAVYDAPPPQQVPPRLLLCLDEAGEQAVYVDGRLAAAPTCVFTSPTVSAMAGRAVELTTRYIDVEVEPWPADADDLPAED